MIVDASARNKPSLRLVYDRRGDFCQADRQYLTQELVVGIEESNRPIVDDFRTLTLFFVDGSDLAFSKGRLRVDTVEADVFKSRGQESHQVESGPILEPFVFHISSMQGFPQFERSSI